MNTKQRIDELKENLSKWSQAYYVDNKPLVSDDIYDQAFFELQQLEKDNPEYLTSTSVTQVVQGMVGAGFAKVKHYEPMLSLKTETDYTELGAKEFITKIRKDLNTEDVNIIAELKYDGLGIDLCYDGHKLISAITRGDGEYGEDVLSNVLLMDDVPKTINTAYPYFMFVRGEIMLNKADFKRINDNRCLTGKKEFVNPRNAAAGLLRSHNPDPSEAKCLILRAYQFIDPESEASNIRTQSNALNFLADLGFKSGITIVCKTYVELWSFHKKVAGCRDKLEYEIDGIVYKVDSFYQQKLLGFIAREPRWAVAHKFPPQEAVSVLEAIDIQVGRTGAVTPVARVKPVYVGGVTISNVTLHNVFDLRSRNVRVGDQIIVRRAGDVIPEVVKDPNFKRVGYHNNFNMTRTCPSCASPVIRSKGERKYYCTGRFLCGAQAKELYCHFVSRTAMRIEGVGEKLIAQLMEKGLLKDFSSLYNLTVEDLLQLEGFELKKANKVIKAIEGSKQTKLSKFIYALGIRHVGEETANMLCEHIDSIESFYRADMNTFLSIDGVGNETTHSVVEYFANEDNRAVVNELLACGITFEVTVKGDKLLGKTFVVTGSFGDTSRDYIKNLIINNGGKFSGSVGKNTNYLIAGEGGGDKRNQAIALNVPTITFNEFLKILT